MNFYNIPIIIISFNRYKCLSQLLHWLITNGYTNIHIIDNASTYAPLLRYYELLEYQYKDNIHIIRLNQNYGFQVLQLTGLINNYNQNYFITTDPDVVPIESCPKNIVEKLYNISKELNATKVGLGLKIDDLPDYYPNKQEVINHESQYFIKQVKENIFDAPIDTTFSLNSPNTWGGLQIHNCYRTTGDLMAYHKTWYLDPNNLPEDEKYYLQSISTATHWSEKLK